MRLINIYDFFIREGCRAELRNQKQIFKQLQKARKENRKLNRFNRQFFDKERFKNPYTDTRILYGNPKKEIQCVLIGIDIGVGELLLVDRLSQQGKHIDLVISHHPLGIALAGLYEMMEMQVDFLHNLGISYEIAKDFMDRRMEEVKRRLHSGNHLRVVDAARLLDIPLMSCHTPADNHVTRYLQTLMDLRKPKTLKKVIDLLLTHPEYQEAEKNKMGPKITVGRPQDDPGQLMVDMTGGTEGSKELFGRLSQLGIGTLLCMHLSEDHFNKIKPEHIHVIVAGHMASDSLGMNLLLDKLVQKTSLEIIECSGFKRVKR